MNSVCLTCITDTHLRATLARGDERCDYCDSQGPTVKVFDLVWACDAVLDSHFETTHLHPSVTIYERAPAGMDLLETVSYLDFAAPNAEHESLLEDIVEGLNSLWWDNDSGVHKHSGDDPLDEPFFRLRSNLGDSLSEVWNNIQLSLQNEARYQNPAATKVLHELFGTIHDDRTHAGLPVVLDAGPGTTVAQLYRARSFQEDAALVEALSHPARLLGTPEPGKGSPGRMNSRGQAAFYGASTVDVAVHEVRPPVGAWVATAAFELVRPVKLLDLRRLAEIQVDHKHSLFNPITLKLSQRRDFLRTLVAKLVQPVMPGSAERDYLTTQVIADFLATHEVEPLDGIIYPTVQKPGADVRVDFNVVLFHRASRVEGAECPQRGRASIWEWEDEESVPRFYPEIWLAPSHPSDKFLLPPFVTGIDIKRPATLVVDLTSIVVEKVREVAIRRDDWRVRVHESRVTSGQT
jgi:hypothetical protein